MCQFGDSTNIISEQTLIQSEGLTGYRSWYITNPFNEKEKFLKSLSQNFIWEKKKITKGNPTKNNSEGIYSYNYYNYNYYNNNYNYYNNDYYYNNYYNYNNYHNYNNYYYYVFGKVKVFGNIFSYNEGYRASEAIVESLVILDDKRWFEDNKTVEFANHFNPIIINLAKEYDCKTIGFSEFSQA